MFLSKIKYPYASIKKRSPLYVLRNLGVLAGFLLFVVACNTGDTPRDADSTAQFESEEQSSEFISDLSIKVSSKNNATHQLKNVARDYKGRAKKHFRKKGCDENYDPGTLVYTLKDGVYVRTDSLQGSADAGTEVKAVAEVEHSVPPGYHTLDASREDYKITVDLSAKESDLKVIIQDEVGKVIETIVDKKMKKGKHRLVWDFKQFDKGFYKCLIAVDEREWSQNIHIE